MNMEYICEMGPNVYSPQARSVVIFSSTHKYI